MDKQKIYETLFDSPLFKGLTIHEIEDILYRENYRLLHFHKKNKIYKLVGTEHYNADIILQGEVVAYMIGPTGKSFMMNRLGKGAIIAPAFIFNEEHQLPVTVKVNEPTIILRFNPNVLRQMIDTNIIIRHNFINILTNIVVRLTQKIRQLGMLSTKEKVVDYLKMRMSETGSAELDITGTRQDIADQIGVQRYSLVRCLGQLEGQGYIKVERKRITVLDKKGLQKM